MSTSDSHIPSRPDQPPQTAGFTVRLLAAVLALAAGAGAVIVAIMLVRSALG
jgi:hypothetical protein